MVVKNQQGVVSILTVILLSVLVGIVALGTVTLQTKELGQSTDNDQSVKAYFAAESGLENALLQLDSNPLARPGDCVTHAANDPFFPSLPNNEQITCVRVTNQIQEGPLQQEQATQFNLHNSPVQTFILQWNKQSDNPFAGYQNDTYYASRDRLPNSGKWPGAPLPAVMEVTAYSYTRCPRNTPCLSASADAGNHLTTFQASTFVLRPYSGGCNFFNDPSCRLDFTLPQSGSRLPVDVRCGSGFYNCEAIFNLDPNKNYIIRLRPRYANTTFTGNFKYNGNDVTPHDEMQIEVTARVGDVLRRIVAFATATAQPFRTLNYAIFARNNICKDFVVSNQRATSNTCNANDDDIPDDTGP